MTLHDDLMMTILGIPAEAPLWPNLIGIGFIENGRKINMINSSIGSILFMAREKFVPKTLSFFFSLIEKHI